MKSHAGSLLVFLMIAFVFVNCKKHGNEDWGDRKGILVLTDKGEPLGNLVTASIGAAGGVLLSADGKYRSV